MAARAVGRHAADPNAIACCRDKRLQRQRMRECRVSTPAFIPVQSPGDIRAALTALALPVVVKPVCGSGSVGVRLCRTEDEAIRHAGALLQETVNERGLPVPGAALIEAFADGTEYS